MYNKNNFHQKMTQIILKSFYDSQTKEKWKIYIKKQCVVQGNDANNSLGFATGADCWCFLVSSVRIWTESSCKAQLSESINLKFQHPHPSVFVHTLYLGGSGEFEQEMSTLTSL